MHGWSISNISPPIPLSPFSPHTFLHRINPSGVKVRPVLKQFMVCMP